MTSKIRVLVADDDALVLAGLSMMLAGADDIQVVAEVRDGTEVLAAVRQHQPDVVLMDIRMPRLDGLSATEKLRSEQPRPEVIIMTTFDTQEHIERAIRAGASGFLLKHTAPADIVQAIRKAARGEPILSPTVLRRVMARLAAATDNPRRDQARGALSRLTPGERAIAELIADGRTNSEIGREQRVSIATVKAYVSRLLTKLDVTNRVQVAKLVHDAELGDRR
ncbi:response regulator transcription factor [Actinoplanes sp. NEAU-A12]|uniref:Response regulator transcription factor n=1 Tax=Actinoplanes sandaracinus TaxID=3045177 RepID=A0ABT6WTE2_9ACTN|nr:response regulator transcription factor [Actinoplanes sandaracinus]MDI6103013.1 response regulator transcription factor [Actinoplanes sandaracinus]